MRKTTLTYKIASEPDELGQIYKLNYQTFVEEIPQHGQNENGHLVDKFDDENTYIIAKNESEVVGMVAVRANRPFSLDQKVNDLDRYMPPLANPCEVRLLSVKKEFRSTRVFYQLIDSLVNYCLKMDYNLVLISGTDRQIRLYKRMGFESFGPMVGTEEAMFQPMYLTKEKFETTTKAFKKMMIQKSRPTKKMNFLPGPVPVHEKVENAFGKESISHRSNDFIEEMKEVRLKLCKLVNANNVQIVIGTGTLANDLISAQLTKIPGKGLILSNGEFGHRLIDHAERFGVDFYTIEKSWNEKITRGEIDDVLKQHPDITWLWTVHCETSTGYLYDITKIQQITKKHNVKLCVDACSSVGVVPVNFQDVYLASTVSGKGLSSYPGLAIVFHQEPISPDKQIPRYLDLGQYAMTNSIPYTHSSNLVAALHEAVKRVDLDYRGYIAAVVRRKLKNAGLEILGDEDYSPGIITIPVPDFISSRDVGDQMKANGMIISYESDYLLKRNWVQLALMGNMTMTEIEKAFTIIKQFISQVVEQV
ncbi:aspartate aminotransferase-like enzyme/N-acyl-L-homoserine lactone synthetase [Bacillus pakistanensis]|uniref:Aspartate aminotransferase-like enzyme/N-acyl-L-homoserine lactone synthetase n=1 Tax=Rossellomorea pakistanensis TaxID=992288 RepID=A0ABS2N6N5_9BACI|nr:aminotransferase class V-fold PLP-dependent enzyme [Bacillus pakistanensis]MBM7583521.1 aspartate aminotransferase-like enzyme/N-acyl-L-homoserine lactone synthetase [Bacillus pakistanensis]